MKSIARIILLILNLFIAGVLLLADLGQVLSPTHIALPSMMGIAFEWLWGLNLLCGIVWLFTKHKSWCALSFLTLLLSLGGLQHTIRVRHPAQEAIQGTQLTIMTYNTCAMGNQRKGLADNPILNYVREQNADIVCLQEFVAYKGEGYTWQEIKAYLGYPYSYVDFKKYKGQRKFGMAVFSKYPLINKETIQYESNTNISNRCDVVVGQDTLRLFTNHLQSNMLTQKDLTWDRLPADEQREYMQKQVQHIENVGGKVANSTRLRAAQAQAVRKEIEKSPYPVIVCGDFNDVPVSYTYHTLAKGLQDAFLTANTWDLGHTYHKDLLGVRIDYVLCDKALQVVSCTTDKVDYSDHYPLHCTLKIPNVANQRKTK